GNYRTQATNRKPCRKGNSMLFSDANIEVAFWKTLMHLLQASTLGHRSRNPNDSFIFLSYLNESIGKNFCIRWWIVEIFLNDACSIIICSRAVPLSRIVLSVFPAFAFFRYDLYDYRPFNMFDILETLE